MRGDVSALDDQLRETVNRALESIRGRLESELGSCQDELLRATQEALASIIETYRTTEARLTANANEIADALTSASGAPNGATNA